MRDWFARQYTDIRGNLKWAVLAFLWWLATTYGKRMLTLIPHIPDWLANAILGVLSVIAFLWMATTLTRSQSSPRPNAADPLPLSPPEKTWGDVMAEEDATKIQERVKSASQRIEFHYALGFDPHIDIITELWNGSVFELVSFGEISGHSLYAGKQLAAEPRIIVPIEPALLTLKHADTATLVVRQYVTADVADTMWANLNRGVAIDFQSVAVSFKVLPRGPGFPNHQYRWWGPRFSIEDATRV
jgi:hypothetical protein